MGPLPELPDLKWLLAFAGIGVGTIIGLLMTGVFWLFEHVRFV